VPSQRNRIAVPERTFRLCPSEAHTLCRNASIIGGRPAVHARRDLAREVRVYRRWGKEVRRPHRRRGERDHVGIVRLLRTQVEDRVACGPHVRCTLLVSNLPFVILSVREPRTSVRADPRRLKPAARPVGRPAVRLTDTPLGRVHRPRRGHSRRPPVCSPA